MSMMALAQNVDSTRNENGSTDFRNNPIQDSAMTEPTNPQPIEGTPRTQDPTSPIIQQQPQQQESPLQPQPQVPTQSQPTVDPNNPTPQPQLNQPVQPQPAQPVQPAPTPTDPTGGGTRPK